LVGITDKGRVQDRRIIITAAGRVLPPPQFATPANTTAAGNNATGKAINLTSDGRPTKTACFNSDASHDEIIDLTNDQPEPKMAPSLPSGTNHGLTDDDFVDLNGPNTTYADIDASQDLDPNLLPHDQVSGHRPQQSRRQQSGHVNNPTNLVGWAEKFDDPVLFGHERGQVAGMVENDKRSNTLCRNPERIYGFHQGSHIRSTDHERDIKAINDAVDNALANLPPRNQAHIRMMQRDAGWHPQNPAIAPNAQAFNASMVSHMRTLEDEEQRIMSDQTSDAALQQHKAFIASRAKKQTVPNAAKKSTPYQYFGNGHTEVVVTPDSVKRTLITAMQPCRRNEVLKVISEVPGFDASTWSHERYLIHRLALSTGVMYKDVEAAVFRATNASSESSFDLQVFLAAPTGTPPVRGELDSTLNNFTYSVYARKELRMIHRKAIDFTAMLPTCFFRNAGDPMVLFDSPLYKNSI
jgi:hypothetical protein